MGRVSSRVEEERSNTRRNTQHGYKSGRKLHEQHRLGMIKSKTQRCRHEGLLGPQVGAENQGKSGISGIEAVQADELSG